MHHNDHSDVGSGNAPRPAPGPSSVAARPGSFSLPLPTAQKIAAEHWTVMDPPALTSYSCTGPSPSASSTMIRRFIPPSRFTVSRSIRRPLTEWVAGSLHSTSTLSTPRPKIPASIRFGERRNYPQVLDGLIALSCAPRGEETRNA